MYENGRILKQLCVTIWHNKDFRKFRKFLAKFMLRQAAEYLLKIQVGAFRAFTKIYHYCSQNSV